MKAETRTFEREAAQNQGREHSRSMSHPSGAPREGALLVGLVLPGTPAWEARDSIEELARLAETAMFIVVDRVLQAQPRVGATYYIGKGKAHELEERSQEAGADVIVFDNDLSPAQMRNLERLTGMRVLDRSAVVLDIFARHARTRTAMVQVELAQLEYLLPRLTRQWTHLSRQAGGGAIRGMGAAGVRGPGETQLEIDRRLIRDRIRSLRRELGRIGSRMATSRKGRGDLFRVALVGYTNAGKSTLMRALSGAEVLVEDRLFATLDSTTRAVDLDGRCKVLLTDTVGFIKRLPHHLLASFRATLEEALEADLLLHVVDLSHPHCDLQRETVQGVLAELGIGDRPMLVVHNKIDRVARCNAVEARAQPAPAGGAGVEVSALSGAGLDELRDRIRDRYRERMVTLDLCIPHAEGRLLSPASRTRRGARTLLRPGRDPPPGATRSAVGRALGPGALSGRLKHGRDPPRNACPMRQAFGRPRARLRARGARSGTEARRRRRPVRSGWRRRRSGWNEAGYRGGARRDVRAVAPASSFVQRSTAAAHRKSAEPDAKAAE